MNFLEENWFALIGYLSGPIAWIVSGRLKEKSDAVSSMQLMYDGFIGDYKNRMDEVMKELMDMRVHNRALQNSFNEIQLAYAKETEISNKWQMLHNELETKYNKLQKDYESLKAEVNKLKKGI